MEKKPRRRLVAFATVLVLLLLLVPFVLGLTVEDILRLTPSNMVLAALVLVLVFCIKNVLMLIPLKVLYMAAGLLFPTPVAVLVCLAGLACEVSIGYFLGRRMGAEKVQALIEKRPRAGRFFEVIGNNDKTACFLARLVPMPVPVDTVSLFFGAAQVPFASYLTFSLLGFLGPMLPFVVAGHAATTPFSKEFLIPLCIGLGLGFFILGVYLLAGKVKKRKKQP